MHIWGDEWDKQHGRKLDEAIRYCMDFWRIFGRIGSHGKEKQIFKDPKTDNGIKKSQKGRVAVLKNKNTLKVVDELSIFDIIKDDMLRTVFKDGKLLIDENFLDIRKRIASTI